MPTVSATGHAVATSTASGVGGKAIYRQLCDCTCTTTGLQLLCPGKIMPSVLDLTITMTPQLCMNNFTDTMYCGVNNGPAWYSPALGTSTFGTLTFCTGVFLGANETTYFGVSCTFSTSTSLTNPVGTLGNVGYFACEFSNGSIQFGTFPGQFISDSILSCNPFHYRLFCLAQGANYDTPWTYPTTPIMQVDITEPV